ncbi:hypothetical protein BaRGS_00032509 [Batillaria attramentaria]|uniref:Uncharacterized protein n=1 Tax=Batillaria attramentaria TaxID=370345 RepID=A0ABD0JNH9_9CAEN
MLFQKSVTKHCQQRRDKWAHEVSAKTDYMYLQDLRAADVVYHRICYTSFRKKNPGGQKSRMFHAEEETPQTKARLGAGRSDVYQKFINGHHVIRRSDRFWAGLSSDLKIEQVLMGSLKSTGGPTRGTGMGEEERLVWLLGMPACTEICAAMQHLTGVRYSGMNST